MAGNKKKYVNPNNSASHSIIQNSKKSKDGYSSKLTKYVKMEHASKKKQDKLNKIKMNETKYQKKIFFDKEDELKEEDEDDEEEKTSQQPKEGLEKDNNEFFEELDIMDRTKKYVSKLKNVPSKTSSNLGNISSSNEWYFFGAANQCRSTEAKSRYLDLALNIDTQREIVANSKVPESIPHVSNFNVGYSHPKQLLSCNGCGETFNSFPGEWINVAPIGIFHNRCANLL